MPIKILFAGDIVGRTGRETLYQSIPKLKSQYSYDLLIVNGENAAGGRGISPAIANDFFAAGVNFITLGDHCWDEKKIIPYLNENSKIIRPANLYASKGGCGYSTIEYQGIKIGIINLVGRIFMSTLSDCPFQLAKRLITDKLKDCQIKIIDFHAEATSEKYAFFRYLKGQVSLIVGTHTHVQTADEQIDQGTGYISDLGMTGSYAGVIGMDQDAAIKRFIDIPAHFEPGEGQAKLAGILASFNPETGQCESIERILFNPS